MRARVGIKMRQIVDWEAAIMSGVISGAIILILNMVLSQLFVGSLWIFIRMAASILMGEDALPPPAGFDWTVTLVGLIVHFALSILFACLIAVIIYRWGLVLGVMGGAFLGLALYVIDFFAISYFFPWFYPLRSWIIVLSHILFGALAGGVYELLEDEEFVPVEE